MCQIKALPFQIEAQTSGATRPTRAELFYEHIEIKSRRGRGAILQSAIPCRSLVLFRFMSERASCSSTFLRPPSPPLMPSRATLSPLMSEGKPFVFVHPRSHRTAILCLVEKAGSSAWMDLLSQTRRTAPRGSDFGARIHPMTVGVDAPIPFRTFDASNEFLQRHTTSLLNNRVRAKRRAEPLSSLSPSTGLIIASC